MVCSTLSNQSLEDIARTGGPGHWFQLYWQPRREVTADLLRRAELAGYSAIMLTVDAPVQVPSLRAQRAGFRMPANCVTANLRAYDDATAVHGLPAGSRFLQGRMRTAPQWQDLIWLQRQTALPVWVKGVLHAEDARTLQAAGVAGVVVSNHGGRGLDGVVASLAALPAIRAAVGAEFPLLLDGGIRSGTDVFKALALGADGVLVGRLQIHALAVAGALGVAHMLKLMREELEVAMALSGCASLAEVRAATLLPTGSLGATARQSPC
jgi:isopentenyl diphosphate isomerase/L-lactate dehydrogenase-like FMN-dependent dehydrogenase